MTAANTSVAQWTAVTVAAPGQPGGTNTGNVWVAKTAELYASDEDGNLLNDGRWNYVWDGENRLVRMTAGTTVGPQLRLDFEYDWRGRRIGKKVWSNVNGTGQPTLSRAYLYRGWNLVMELDASATPKTMLTQYVWGRDLAGGVDGAGLPGQQGQATAGGVGGLVEIRTATATYGVVYDGNGNVMGLVDGSNGTVAARYEYGPFGELIRASGPMAKNNPFRFSTKYQDDETDLVYYGYRFYNASTGRWLGRDPIEEWGGLNLMAFIYNDGLNWVDLLGLDEAATAASARAELLSDDEGAQRTVCYYQGVKDGGVSAAKVLVDNVPVISDAAIVVTGETLSGESSSRTAAVGGMIAGPVVKIVKTAISKCKTLVCVTRKWFSPAAKTTSKVDDIVKQIDEVVESGGKVKINKAGDPIITQGDKRIRIDSNNPHGDKPHFHHEKQTPSGKWKDAGPEHRYYFKED